MNNNMRESRRISLALLLNYTHLNGITSLLCLKEREFQVI